MLNSFFILIKKKMCVLYIIYSNLIDRFYVGFTCDDLNNRINKHNSNHKGFTGKANDWTLKYFEEYDNKTDARKREIEIKKWKSRKRIVKLIESN